MFMSLIQNRRSVRKFSSRAVAPETIDTLVEAALRSPSSRGFNPWEFIVVTDSRMLAGLSEAKPHGSAFLKNAPLGIVVLGVPEKSDVWVEDTAIASVFIHLAAASLGLGSCWIQIRKRTRGDGQPSGEYIAGLLNIPAGREVESIIAVGYPAETTQPRGKEVLSPEKVHIGVYGKSA